MIQREMQRIFFFWGGGESPERGGVELHFGLQNFNPNDKLIYIIDLLTQFLNDQTVNYTFTLFWTVQQHIPNVQQHIPTVQQHIPAVQQHILSIVILMKTQSLTLTLT